MTDRLRSPAKTREESDQQASAGVTESDDTCPECDGRTTPLDKRGETICTDCGLVVEADRIEPDYRSLQNGDGDSRDPNRRVQMPATRPRHDSGLSTKIGQNVDGNGNTLSGMQRQRLRRLRKWNVRCDADSAGHEGHRFCANEIRRTGAAVGLSPTVQQTAMRFVEDAIEAELLKGRSYEGFVGAATYLAARQHSAVRPITSIVEVSRVDGDQIKRCVFILQNELGLKIEPPRPVEYWPWVINSVKMAVPIDKRDAIDWCQLYREGQNFLREIQEQGRGQGNSPIVLTGTVIYYLSQDHHDSADLSQAAIAEAIGISDTAIRNNKDLFEATIRNTGDSPDPEPP
jgi:transcription initiation factor TFIIB